MIFTKLAWDLPVLARFLAALRGMRFMPALAGIISACCACPPSFAYEFENAVPLTLGVQMGEARIKDVHLTLNGREAEVRITFRNDSQRLQSVGFYAVTPLFENLGDGEEHADKTFSELKAFHNGKPLMVSSTQRGYFLGKDITSVLRKAGIGPIPSSQVDERRIAKLPPLQNMRIEDWQGQVSFGWSAQISPVSTAIETVKYTALPRFGLENLDSGTFTQLVHQHCGKPENLKSLVHRAAPDETQVFAEVFEFPLPFLKMEDTRVTIEKPRKQGMDMRPLIAVACGYDGALTVPSDGRVRSANNAISILVLSLVSDVPEVEIRSDD